MRPLIRVALVTALAVVLSASLTACANGDDATASSGDLVADERPVPDGMPVMYEFFTAS